MITILIKQNFMASHNTANLWFLALKSLNYAYTAFGATRHTFPNAFL